MWLFLILTGWFENVKWEPGKEKFGNLEYGEELVGVEGPEGRLL